MAIEPLSSAMTYQAQAAVKPQTAQPVNTEVPEDGQTVNVDATTASGCILVMDATTASITKIQPEEEKAGSEGNGSQQQQEKEELYTPETPEHLKKMIAEMNRKISNSNEEAVFGVHEKTNRIMIKILDKDTKEIIKEFPPEKTLDMIASIWEMAGILVDEKR